ncbi:unnamed protein product, partial [Coregonus sp. 'balchen']
RMKNQQHTSRYLLLHVWCGFLTVAMSHLSESKEENQHPTTPHLSYIQLTMEGTVSWENDHDIPICGSCSLVLRNNSVYIASEGFYYFFAQVTFTRYIRGEEKRKVTLIKNAIQNKTAQRSLSEAVYHGEKEGTVFMSRMVKLQQGNSLSLEITPNSFRNGGENTYWGAYQLPPY